MTTKALAKPGPVAVVSVPFPPKKRGRPARPWLAPWVPVPHPVDDRQSRTFSPAQVAAWTGRSRQTVARWAEAGAIPDLAALRLCQLYGYGLPPIPPEEWANPSAARWLAFRFVRDDQRPHLRTRHGQWCLAPETGRSMNAEQVRSLAITLAAFAALEVRLQAATRALADAEADAARLRDLVAYQ